MKFYRKIRVIVQSIVYFVYNSHCKLLFICVQKTIQQLCQRMYTLVWFRLWKCSKCAITLTGRKKMSISCCCLAAVHAKSYSVSFIAIAAFVHLLGIQNASQTTNRANQRNTVKLLLTLPPVKIKTKSQFSWP